MSAPEAHDPQADSTAADTSGTRVFLLDDHEIVRRGLRQLIDAQPDMHVVGEASTAGEAMLRVPAARPDVALLDVQLPDGDGIEVCRELRADHPDLACVMLTSFGGDEALLSAIIAGARGFLLKQVDGGALVDAVRKVAAGQWLIEPAVMARAMDRVRVEHEAYSRLEQLTPRERRILDLIADGRTNRQIADELILAEKTIKNSVSDILSKLGLSRRTEAAVYAVHAQQAQRAHDRGR